MWKLTAALAALVLALAVATFVIRGEQHGAGQPESGSTASNRLRLISGRDCGRAVLRDWVNDGRIDNTYARKCYLSALRLLPQDGVLVEPFDAIVDALKGPTNY